LEPQLEVVLNGMREARAEVGADNAVGRDSQALEGRTVQRPSLGRPGGQVQLVAGAQCVENVPYLVSYVIEVQLCRIENLLRPSAASTLSHLSPA
jgi:hypothetical protein